eukprot:113004-Pelagomonas_calceolata.AAC.2
MGMELVSKFNGTLVVQPHEQLISCSNWLRVQQVPPTPRRMVWRVTTFALTSLQRPACCRCAASICCPGLVSSQYFISIKCMRPETCLETSVFSWITCKERYLSRLEQLQAHDENSSKKLKTAMLTQPDMHSL